MTSIPAAANATYDVVIIGGAFSGASTALLLKRSHPNARVLIVERQETFDRKVGESTSEVAGCFLTRVLHMGAYMSANHYQKHGLRMWFCKDGSESVDECTELGPRYQSRLPTYQIDRSLLDEEVLRRAREAGAELMRPAAVGDISLAEGADLHTIEITDTDKRQFLVSCRWVIDASGKAAVLAKRRGTHRLLGDEHPTSSMWCRFQNVTDLDSYEARQQAPRLQGGKASRGPATNHLMGKGWWCWLIPLPGGDFSAGIVWDRTLFDLPPGPSMVERLRAHLLSHPVGRLMFQNATPVEGDFYYYKGLAYHATEVAGNRWIIVGDAAGFIDPLYSQGLDYCGHSVYAAVDTMKIDLNGGCPKGRLAYINEAYPRSYHYWFNALYKGKYLYLGDAELMRAAFFLDLSSYFIGPVRLVYGDMDREFRVFPYDGPHGRRFAAFMKFYNQRLHKLAEKRLALGTYGEMNTGMDYTIPQAMSPDSAAVKFLWRGLKIWWRAELRTFWQSLTRRSVSLADVGATATAPAAPT
jgi:flavin-dependent dehydrogenase